MRKDIEKYNNILHLNDIAGFWKDENQTYSIFSQKFGQVKSICPSSFEKFNLPVFNKIYDILIKFNEYKTNNYKTLLNFAFEEQNCDNKTEHFF